MDLTIALRRLVRNPAFFVTASLSLALGIGANTAAFSVAHAVLWRAMPVRDPGSLAIVATRNTGFQYSMSYPAYTYLRDHAQSLDGLIAFRAQPVNVTAGGTTERLTGMLVSDNYFQVLDVRTASGTAIRSDSDVLLSHAYWQRRFGRSADVVGTSLRINGHSFTIAGVTAPGFQGTRVGSLPDLFMPMAFAARLFDVPNWMSNPRNNWLRIIARLAPATGIRQAQAEMTVAFRQFGQDVLLPLANTDTQRRRAREGTIALEAGRAGLMEMGTAVRPTLFTLMGLVALVLVVACVNVSNLMVAHAERRHRETAIALALGATGFRLWRQSLYESATIGAAGIAIGIGVALGMRGLLVRLLPPRAELDVSIDARVLGMSVLLTSLTIVVLASVTARYGARLGTANALKGGGPAARLRLRQGRIVVQLAVSLVVLVTATLFAQTLERLSEVNPGFERDGILIASLSTDGYSPERRRAFHARVLEEARSLPGVVAAAFASDEPLNVGTGWTIVSRRTSAAAGATVSSVSREYFKTMGIPILKGRDFEDRDDASPRNPVIVNENFVRTYLPANEDPIGATIVGNGTTTFAIVGVVKDSASIGLRDLDQQMLYVPRGGGVLHLRAAVAPASLAAPVIAMIRRLDPDVPVVNVRTIDEQIDRALGTERAFATLSATFGLTALVLSAVGLYGVMAGAVSRRTRELGIRVALGAAPRLIVRQVLGEAGMLLAVGAALGLPLALMTGRAMRSLLFGVQPGQWQTLALPLLVLLGVGALAAWSPARRASRVDPMAALRAD